MEDVGDLIFFDVGFLLLVFLNFLEEVPVVQVLHDDAGLKVIPQGAGGFR